MIECESLPHAQMRVGIHVSLSLCLGHLGSKIFKDGARFVVRGDLDDPTEFHVVLELSREGRADPNYHLEVIIRLRGLGLK